MVQIGQLVLYAVCFVITKRLGGFFWRGGVVLTFCYNFKQINNSNDLLSFITGAAFEYFAFD